MRVPGWLFDVSRRVETSGKSICLHSGWVTGCAFPGGCLMYAFPDGWKHLESPFVYIPSVGNVWVGD